MATYEHIRPSWLGLLPGTSSVHQILRGEALATGAGRALTWLGLAAAVLALTTIALIARNAVNQVSSFNQE